MKNIIMAKGLNVSKVYGNISIDSNYLDHLNNMIKRHVDIYGKLPKIKFSYSFNFSDINYGIYVADLNIGYKQLDNDCSVNPLSDSNGITIKQLKDFVKDLPEKDENDEDYTVWISDFNDHFSNVAKSIYPLNKGDVLISS